MMNISDSQSADSSALDEAGGNYQSSSRLQQKIEVVQQILTILEQTMSQGTSMHERGASSVQESINRLQRTIDNLKSNLAQREVEFTRFSTILGGEINKFCALDNILRTVEESRTENDVKILLPDVSTTDGFVQQYSENKSQDWAKLKEDISRLNNESQNEDKLLKSITYRVTLRKRIFVNSPCNQASAIALALNQLMGKSIPSENKVKFIKIIWNDNNQVAASNVYNNALQIVKQIFQNEGEVVMIQEISREDNLSAINDFQNVYVHPQESLSTEQPSISTSNSLASLQQNLENGRKTFMIYQVGEPISANPNANANPTSVHQTQMTSIGLVPELNDDEIEIIKEVKNLRPIKIIPKAQESVKVSNLRNSGSEISTPVIPTTPLLVNTLSSSSPQSQPQEERSQNLRKILPTANNVTNFSSDSASEFLKAPQRKNFIISNSINPISNQSRKNKDLNRQANVEMNNILKLQIHQVDRQREVINRVSLTELLGLPQPQNNLGTLENLEPQNITDPIPVVDLNASISNETAVENMEESSTQIKHNIDPADKYVDNFCGLQLKKDIICKMKENGIITLKQFQREILEAMIAGKDIICQRSKKSGKSIAAVLGLIQKIDLKIQSPQVILATHTPHHTQVIQEIIRNFGENMQIICRSADELISCSSYMQFQYPPIKDNSHVLVGAPVSILKLLNANKFQNETVNTLILDDADDMLTLGFKSSILQVVYGLNSTTQLIFTSTKMTESLQVLCNRTLRNAVSILQVNVESEIQIKPDLKIINDKLKPPREKNQDSSTSVLLYSKEPYVPEYNGSESKIMEDDRVSISSLSLNSLDRNFDNDSGDESDIESVWSKSSSHSSSAVRISIDEEDYVDFGALHIRQNSVQEIETMVRASELLKADENLMTFIPDYILNKLGVPMIMDYNVDNESISSDHNLKSSNKLNHIYVLLNEDEQKVETLAQLDIDDEKTVIFCNSIEKVEWLASRLRQRKLWPQTLHEDMSKQDWGPILHHFSRGKICKLIICTDFLTEITLQGASFVINYDFPKPARNYISRAAFGSRHIELGEYSKKPNVISFVKPCNLDEIKDLKKHFDIDMTPMALNGGFSGHSKI